MIGFGEAVGLLRAWTLLRVLQLAPLARVLIAEDEAARYDVTHDVLITTPAGVTLSAIVVRPRRATDPLPAALTFTIYADPVANLRRATSAAARGYAGVVVDARGKRLSSDEIIPYEVEVNDTYAAIDWIATQPWSNGEVGMIGGSYEGFAAWAATKRLHRSPRSTPPM